MYFKSSLDRFRCSSSIYYLHVHVLQCKPLLYEICNNSLKKKKALLSAVSPHTPVPPN